MAVHCNLPRFFRFREASIAASCGACMLAGGIARGEFRLPCRRCPPSHIAYYGTNVTDAVEPAPAQYRVGVANGAQLTAASLNKVNTSPDHDAHGVVEVLHS